MAVGVLRQGKGDCKYQNTLFKQNSYESSSDWLECDSCCVSFPKTRRYSVCCNIFFFFFYFLCSMQRSYSCFRFVRYCKILFKFSLWLLLGINKVTVLIFTWMRKSKPLIYFVMSLWHLAFKPNMMKEVNFKGFHWFYDFLVSIGKRTVKIVKSWRVGSPLLPPPHYGNGEAKAILNLSAKMLCTFTAIISMFKMLLLSRNASFRCAGRAKEVYFVDPSARFINISEKVILEQGSLHTVLWSCTFPALQHYWFLFTGLFPVCMLFCSMVPPISFPVFELSCSLTS